MIWLSWFRVVTDYLIGHENTTVVYNCIQPVSISLLVTLLDFDENTVIKPFNMRSGIGQNSNSTPLIQTESRHMEYQMDKINFHISSMGRKRNRRGRVNAKDRVVLWRSLSLPIEIRKLVLFIWYSMCRDSVCIIWTYLSLLIQRWESPQKEGAKSIFGL